MGSLDSKSYAAKIAGCTTCDRKAFDVSAYLDREQALMIGEPSQDGRWVHDDAAFAAGVYRIRCLGCGTDAHAADECPRCARPGALAGALASHARVAIPKMCPQCKTTSMTLTAAVPARIRAGEGQPTSPAPIARFGEPGYQIGKLACDGCDWTSVPEGCAVCGGR
jgi:hypothetical protein